jgi:transaldolase
VGEILALAGCDRLTIAPALLEELKSSTDDVERHLDPATAGAEYEGGKLDISEAAFRFQLNADAMATEKLSEGIRAFCADIEKLEAVLREKLTAI